MAQRRQGAIDFDEPSPSNDEISRADYAFSHEQFEYHRGPIPDPGALAYYDQVLPGAADRILAMAEKQLDAEVADQHRLVLAQSRAVEWSAALVGLVPYMLGAVAVVLVVLGAAGIAGIIAAIAAVVHVVPRVIAASKGHAVGPDQSTEDG